MADSKDLTPQEMDELRDYIAAMKELEKVEPSMWDDIETDTETSSKWGEWNKQCVELNNKHHDVIVKAFLQYLRLGDTWEDSPQSVALIIDALIMGNTPSGAADHRPRIDSKPPSKIEYPLDKINSNIWSLLEAIEPSGQLAFATEKRGTAREATILYSINFDQIEPEVSITKKLTPFDKRCYISVAALYNNGNPIISAAQIYAVMGNKGRPSAKDVQKINSSLTKMAAARVYINNEQEITVNKKYNRFVYDAPLLPFERVTAIINNQPCESAIHLFREPPLVTFAKDRKQITTIPRKLLECPISKTDANLRIDDYLIERIAHIKNGRVKNRLLFATIYKQCGITEKKQRQRAPEKIRRYLDHYKKCGFIKDYSEEIDGVTITY